jgi:hypothetical protein
MVIDTSCWSWAQPEKFSKKPAVTDSPIALNHFQVMKTPPVRN